MADDEDWEQADHRLGALAITTCGGPDQLQGPVSILQRPQAAEMQSASSSFPPPPPDEGKDEIDSALLSAIDNPRERMALFQIEDIILSFVKSSDRMMEVPPGLNSFRRLLAYRVGQRFGLGTSASDNFNESGERGIVLFKTPNTAIPKLLLIDLADKERDESGSEPPLEGESSSDKQPAARKVLVMKRQTASAPASSLRPTNNRQQLSAEDRERAYQEARARIFGEEAAIDSPGRRSSASSPAPSQDAYLRHSNSGQRLSDQVSESLDDSRKLVAGATVNIVSSDSSKVATAGNLSSNSHFAGLNSSGTGGSRSRVVDAGSWKGKRGQVRDIYAEKSDPDFVRRSSSQMMKAPSYSSQQMYGSAPEPTTYMAYYRSSDQYYDGGYPVQQDMSAYQARMLINMMPSSEVSSHYDNRDAAVDANAASSWRWTQPSYDPMANGPWASASPNYASAANAADRHVNDLRMSARPTNNNANNRNANPAYHNADFPPLS